MNLLSSLCSVIRHLASRVQVGSPVTMRLLQLPSHLEISNHSQTHKITVFIMKQSQLCCISCECVSVCLRVCVLGFESPPLVWEEDMQMRSKFLDRKVTNDVLIWCLILDSFIQTDCTWIILFPPIHLINPFNRTEYECVFMSRVGRRSWRQIMPRTWDSIQRSVP